MAMRITELRAKNVKRLKLVELFFNEDENLFVVGGENDQGKSSVLDSIMYALGGGSTLPGQPVRTGEQKAEITVTIDGDGDERLPLVVTRKFTSKGSTLEIKAKGDTKLSSPQAVLDAIVSQFTFDPLEFSRQSPKVQADTLRELVGIDFSGLDRMYASRFEGRTGVNRTAKGLSASLEVAPFHADVPKEEVSVAVLMTELRRREDVNDLNAKIADSLEDAKTTAENAGGRVCDIKKNIEDLQAELVIEENSLRDANAAHSDLRKRVESLTSEDTNEIREQIESSETTNTMIRENKQRDAIAEQLKDVEEQSKSLSKELEGILAEKEQLLASAEWPVEGLGFDEDGVTLNNLPFDQASSSQRLLTSVAIGFATNPELNLLFIRDGSLIDDKHLVELAEIAKGQGGQVIIERVGQGNECSVIIEDGAVKPAKTPSH